MSLILVVEPDSLHAAQLESMARTHLNAEIVMADSADRGVAALAHRVPDIVLTTPLLPGRDEEVLSKYLRALGAAAAHVQTLTIPILSAAATAPERTMLGRLRRERPRMDDTDGCDPAMFADQIGQYLRRARQSRAEVSASPMPTPVPEPAVAMPEPITALTPMLVDAEHEEAAEPLVAQVVPASSAYVRDPEANDVLDDPGDDLDDELANDVIVMEGIGEEVDLSELLNELSQSALPPVPAVPPVALSRTRSTPIERPSRPAWFDGEVLVPTVLPRAARPRESAHRAREAARGPAPRESQALTRAPEAQPANVQQMITIPSGDGGHIHASVNVSVAVAVQVSATTATAAPPANRRPRAPKPVQDEWGFFDPDQCGFRALIARLDAIAEVEEAE